MVDSGLAVAGVSAGTGGGLVATPSLNPAGAHTANSRYTGMNNTVPVAGYNSTSWGWSQPSLVK